MGIREEAFQSIEGEGYPVTSKKRKLEIPLSKNAPPDVKRWLHEYAVKTMSPRRHVLGVSLMVEYELLDDNSAF